MMASAGKCCSRRGDQWGEREEREGRQRTEYECRHFPGWPIVCRVSVLEAGDMPHRADKQGVYQAPSCRG